MPKPAIALVTAAVARNLDEDLPPLVAALTDAGADVAVVDWDDPAVDWSRFDIALLRSAWDYSMRFDAFLRWMEDAAVRTRLSNPSAIVRWNTDKHYLAELGHRGIAVVPSAFVEIDADAAAELDRFLDDHASSPEFVVKPSVGAGSRDAQRYGRDARDAALVHVRRLCADRRSVVLQPYLDRVDEAGETALIFFDGVFSHAIRKGPLLRRNEAPTRALFAAEHITAREPTVAELALAQRTLASMPFDGPLLYARVDLIQGTDGEPRVLELELAEPSLFFAHSAGSAARVAGAVMRRCR